MARTTIDRLIINSPYEEPQRYWRYDRETRTFELVEGRRPAGYVVATPGSKSFDDPGIFVEIPLVNRIRPRVKAWREAGCPGVTSITKRLLAHWRDPEEFDRRRFFFCQLEAVETLIWLIEAPAAERVGIEIRGDGGDFLRRCCKMATGTGKTIVMAMTIAWHILNKVANPQDARFSKWRASSSTSGRPYGRRIRRDSPPSSTATIRFDQLGRCAPGIPASPVSAPRNRTSTCAFTTAPGRHRRPLCSTIARLWQHGRKMIT
jgi:hypothetical protein